MCRKKFFKRNSQRKLLILGLIVMSFAFIQCNERNVSVRDQQIENLLNQADSFKVINFEHSDSLLTVIDTLCKGSESDPHNISKYYYLKSYLSYSKENLSQAISYLDSLTTILYQNPNELLLSRSYLVKGLINEKLYSFDDALELYHAAFESITSSYNNEKFIALLGITRIHFKSKNEYLNYKTMLDSMMSIDSSIDKGLYYSNMAKFSNNYEEKIRYSSQALQFYKKQNNEKHAILVYSRLIDTYLKAHYLDSAKNVLNELIDYSGGTNFPNAYMHSKPQLFYYHSVIRSRSGNFERSKSIIEDGIKHAIPIKQYDKLRVLYNLKGDIYGWENKHQQATKEYRTAIFYDKKFHTLLNSDKINVAEFKFQLELTKADLQTVKKDNKIQRLSLWITITWICILLSLLYFLFNKWNNIKAALASTSKKYKNAKIETAKSKQTLKTIEEAVLSQTKSYAQMHHEIQGLLSEDTVDEKELKDALFSDIELRQKVYKVFPDIVESQFRFIVCIYFDLDTKSTMQILELKQEAYRARRKRLPGQINMPKDAKLNDYIKTKIR